MVKVTQNLCKESYHDIFDLNSLGSSWLWGSNSCLPSSLAEFKSRRGKGFFQIGMIIKLSLGSTYQNTVYSKINFKGGYFLKFWYFQHQSQSKEFFLRDKSSYRFMKTFRYFFEPLRMVGLELRSSNGGDTFPWVCCVPSDLITWQNDIFSSDKWWARLKKHCITPKDGSGNSVHVLKF